MDQQTGFVELDGRRIAYATVGDGPLLVMPSWWVSHLLEDWRDDGFRRFVEALARRYTVVRYDRLGTGLSDRERPADTLTLDYEVALLETVVDELSPGSLSLFGMSCGACTSAVYAVRHPETVDRVVLYGSYSNGPALGPADALTAMVELVRSAWGLGSQMLVDVFMPNVPPERRRAMAAYQRAAATPETAAELLRLVFAYDVRDSLPAMSVPTLVVHRDRDRAIPARVGREVADLVPGAGFVSVPGDAHLPWHGDVADSVEAVAAFLGVPPPSRDAQADGVGELSEREREVLRLVAEGLSDADIAERLVLSPHTVHRHVANIRRKLGLHSRSAAAAAAARAGLI
ncbi:MAG TPA: alpha/beta fold hydrolase [Gaiellaceae bacterium]|nr:alpha/beta fold hydrolase [Gaiellaceae bacterium]